ncbi:MAG: RecQ family ATP-dependent DNA helicase [Clostridia bacterium]|nr:RecQ family ATP-dependent DNA helicase [Clostridia bacterium]
MSEEYEVKKDNGTLKALKSFFGYDSFRPGQREVVEAILSQKDVLAVMPTGSGKSICYQLPALMLGGITIVVSPLISLMRDQVASLCASGVRAAYINSTLSAKQCSLAMANASRGEYKIIYVAPERLESPQFLGFAQKADISLVAIDEAHCVSQWGHDFRRSYLGIKDFVASLKRRPVVAAFTATATVRVKEDIRELLELRDPASFTTGYDRPELYFGIDSVPDKEAYIIDFITRRPHKAGIVYCATRKNVDLLCERLVYHGISAAKYHAGLSEAERNRAQDDFIYDRCRVIVATNAFGMGIDKSNVAFVLHYNMPLSIEAYYQEAGRAGRDGMDAECVLLYSYRDVKLGEYLIDISGEYSEDDPEEAEKIRKINKEKLAQMDSLCKDKGCVRANILAYFGEKYKDDRCGKCSACLKRNSKVTLDSMKLIIGGLVYKTGGRYGAAAIVDILAGKRTEKFAARGYDRLFEFGAFRLHDKASVRAMIEEMINEGFLERTRGEYPLIKVTELYMRESAKKAPEIGRFPAPKPLRADEAIVAEIRSWRTKTAYKLGIPPYIILTDLTVNMLAIDKPTDMLSLLKVKGISEKKAEKYGREIISIIKKHKNMP